MLCWFTDAVYKSYWLRGCVWSGELEESAGLYEEALKLARAAGDEEAVEQLEEGLKELEKRRDERSGSAKDDPAAKEWPALRSVRRIHTGNAQWHYSLEELPDCTWSFIIQLPCLAITSTSVFPSTSDSLRRIFHRKLISNKKTKGPKCLKLSLQTLLLENPTQEGQWEVVMGRSFQRGLLGMPGCFQRKENYK